MTQKNLGNVYSDRIRGDRAQNPENAIETFQSENLELAIAAYQNASEIYTREAFPKEWAEIQHNIGKLLVHQKNQLRKNYLKKNKIRE